MALTITAFDVNNDGTGIDVAAYLADYDANYAPQGFGYFSTNPNDFSGKQFGNTEQTSLSPDPTKQSVVFDSGISGGLLEYDFPTHILRGDLNALSFGHALAYQSATDTFAQLRDLQISGFGYVDQTGAGNPVHTLVYNMITGNTSVLNGLLSSNAIIFVGSTGADTFTGYSLDDTLNGGAGNDTLNGAGGNDTINGGAGNDTLNGGDGTDTADYSGAAAGVTVSLLNAAQQDTVGAGLDTLSNFENLTGSALDDTLTGNNSANVLTGGNGKDKLNGRNGNDTLIGGVGNDTLNGGVGNDIMTGGVGNDFYIVDSANDVVNEAAGEGTADKISTSVSYTLAAGVDVEILTAAAGAPGLALTGNEIVNKIYGGAGNDTLDGGGGNDLMFGGAGNDSYIVSDAGDRVTENADSGTDTVITSISFNLGDNVENLTQTGSADLISYGNELNNTINGNSGANKLYGLDGNDTIDGKDGADTIFGGAGQDTLTGGEGDDKLYGGDDADTIIGGAGRDILTGDAGSDVFVYQNLSDSGTTGTTRDQIADFQVGIDKIDLSQLDAITGGSDDGFNFVGSGALQNAGDLRAFASGGNTVIAGDVDGDHVADFHILLQGSVAITGTDFIL